MFKIRSVFCIVLLPASLSFISCNKKSHPAKASATVISKNDTASVAKASVKPKTKTAVPKVISVDDKSAKRTFDGRLYYDLMGHRYWRSKKDGKYYLYNKNMHNDPAFQK